MSQLLDPQANSQKAFANKMLKQEHAAESVTVENVIKWWRRDLVYLEGVADALNLTMMKGKIDGMRSTLNQLETNLAEGGEE